METYVGVDIRHWEKVSLDFIPSETGSYRGF